MRTVKINNIEVVILRDTDIASYIKRIYASNEMRMLATTGNSFESVKENSSMLAEFLVQYAISTGDLSSASITEIAKKFIDRQSDLKKLTMSNCNYNTGKVAKQFLFEDIAMPKIVEAWANKLNMKKPYSFGDLSRIASIVGLQSNNNVFHTHSFNTAILDDVEENGLDISKELFKKELLEFMPIGSQPYKTGVLNTCELSKSTFGYASIVPERVRSILSGKGGIMEPQREDETTKDFLTRCVDKNLEENTSITTVQKAKLKANSDKIIDFYYGHQSASIAIIKQNEKIEDKVPNPNNILMSAYSQFKSKPITRKMYQNIPMEYRKQLDSILLSKDKENFIRQLDLIADQIRRTNPECEHVLTNMTTYMFGEALCRVSLNNFLQSFGDGYDIEGGKIDRSKFAIATYQDPAKMFSYYKSAQKKLKEHGQKNPNQSNTQNINVDESENS